MASNTRGTENFTTILSKVSSLCLHSLFSFFVVPFSLVNYLYIYIKFLSLLRSCSFTSRRSYEATMSKILWNRSVPKNTREYQAWNDSTHSGPFMHHCCVHCFKFRWQWILPKIQESTFVDSSGSCGFGASCWYSHTNPQMLVAAQTTSKCNIVSLLLLF